MSSNDLPDPFVEALVNDLAKDIYIWRMAKAMLESDVPARRASAVTRMRNAEERITQTALEQVEKEYARPDDKARREWEDERQ